MPDSSTPADPDRTLSYVFASELTSTSAQLLPPVIPRQGLSHTTLGERYELQDYIGCGGMGEVYSALDCRLGRRVAVKLIRSDRLAQQGDLLRKAFELEVQLSASLLHPSIATLFDYGFHNDTPFAVFEFLPGKSLRDLIQERTRLPLIDVQRIIAALAVALDHAHGNGIVHRDLKPENIRCNAHGQFKILDLGLARNFHLQENWQFSGTPAYASPEQAREAPSDGRADQYALGLIAFELLTGTRPFQAATVSQMLEQHRSAEPPAPASLVTDLSANVNAAVLRALRKDPNERFLNCESFASALGAQFSIQSLDSAESISSDHVYEVPHPMAAIFAGTDVYLALHGGRLWILKHKASPVRPWLREDRLSSWPVSAIQVLKTVVTNGGAKVQFTQDQTRHTTWYLFRTKDLADLWAEQLRGIQQISPAEVTEKPFRHNMPAQSSSRPNVPLQVMGACQALGRTRADAARALSLHAAALRGNGVIEVRFEDCPTAEQNWVRASGVAVRTVDSSGVQEFHRRNFTDAAGRVVLASLIVTVGLILVSFRVPEPIISNLFLGDFVTIAPTAVVIGLYTVPILFSLALWRIKSPKLLRPMAIVFAMLGFAPGMFAILDNRLPSAARSLARFSLFTHPVYWMLIVVALGVSGNLWQLHRRVLAELSVDSQSHAAERSALNRLSFTANAMASAYAAGILLYIAIHAIHIWNGSFKAPLP